MSWITKLFPFLLWIKDLSNPKTLKADILAGLTVGFVIVPQSMAYAQLAGLSPQYGLYAAFLPVLVAAVMGSSRQLSTGPVAVVSLLTAAALGEIVTDPSSYAVYAALLALIVGIFQFLLGVLRLGFVVNFLSHPVVTGFTSAAAIIIGASQLPKVFGIRVISSNDTDWVSACQTLSIPERVESVDVGGLHTICNADQSYETIARLLEAAFYFTHLPTLAMALMGVVGILILQRFFPRLPAILTVAVISTAASFLIDYQGMGGAIVNSININGLFSFKIPRFDFNVMGTLFVYAITISEILHLHRVQRDIDDIAIGIHARHLDPVAHAQHVVAGQLDAGDEAEDGVLEHQQQDRLHGAQPRQQQQRRLFDQHRDHQDRRTAVHRDLDHLDIALDRAAACLGTARITLVGVIERPADRHRHRQHDQRTHDIDGDRHQFVRQIGHQIDPARHHQQGDHRGEPCHRAIGGIATPVEIGRRRAQQHAFDQPVHCQRHHHQTGEGDQRLEP